MKKVKCACGSSIESKEHIDLHDLRKLGWRSNPYKIGDFFCARCAPVMID